MKSSRNRGITLRDLSTKNDARVLDSIVAEQVKIIDSIITMANTAGSDSAVYLLPTNFTINRMARANAQTAVYSELLRVMRDEKGFASTYIDLGVKPRLTVVWKNGFGEAELQRRLRYIHECRTPDRQ